MKHDIAERLIELRKEKEFSQEELADRINVSRQTVSKWERREAVPDTSNLIEISKVYGIGLDELVYGEKEDEYKEKQDYGKNNSFYGTIYTVYTVAVVCAYILLGFLLSGDKGWTHFWFLFITIPVMGSLIKAVNKKKVAKFNYGCFVTALYCALGMFLGLWHPAWVLFITIPAFYAVAELIDKRK